MNTLGNRLGILCLAVALGVTACTDSEPDESGQPAAKAPAPQWTEIAMPRKALPDKSVRRVSTAINRDGDLPLTLGGSVTKPGKPSRAALWQPSGKRGNGGRQQQVKPRLLDVEAAESSVDGFRQIGDHTYVHGWSWKDGVGRSFVQRSTDRRAWEPVELPEELADRDLLVDTVVDDGEGAPLAIASTLEKVVAVDLSTGALVDLPVSTDEKAYHARAATRRKAIVVLTDAQDGEARNRVLPYVSTDRGRAWTVGAPLPGAEVAVSGVVATGSGFVATGSRLVGNDRRAAAWFSRDGRAWKRESLPGAGGMNIDARLSAPAANNTGVYAAYADDDSLGLSILKRGPRGRWAWFGFTTFDWEIPGTGATLAIEGATVLYARSQDGRLQLMRQWTENDVRIAQRITTSSSTSPVEWWDSIRVGTGLQAVGGRTYFDVSDDDAGVPSYWNRQRNLTAFALDGSMLKPTTFRPRVASDLTDLSSETGPDGTEVLAGMKVGTQRDGRRTDTLLAWVKRPGRPWESVRGLPPSGHFDLESVQYVGDTWVITADDAVDSSGGHTHGALWTSTDGRRWQRESGPFDVHPHRDSGLPGACSLPGGDLMAVGWTNDPDVSAQPLGFRRVDGQWQRMNLDGLGGEAKSLHSCTAASDVTLVQGATLTSTVWRTDDGHAFDRVEIGEEQDWVGTIVSVPGGFAAPGTRYGGSRHQAVVWLSPDGEDWTAVPVPVERPMAPGAVIPWEDRLVVPLTGTGGPGMFVLENLEALLTAARDR